VSVIEQTAMARTLPTLLPADLELRLLRKGVGVLAEGRDRCADCGRTPLTGEQVHHYGSRTLVCELCRPLRRREPDRTARVPHSERGQTVKVRAA
jgi:hypothetical protein